MNKHLFTKRILISVRKLFGKAKPFNKERLIDEIASDCFTDAGDRETWRPIVAERIELLLAEEGALFPICRVCAVRVKMGGAAAAMFALLMPSNMSMEQLQLIGIVA